MKSYLVSRESHLLLRKEISNIYSMWGGADLMSPTVEQESPVFTRAGPPVYTNVGVRFIEPAK